MGEVIKNEIRPNRLGHVANRFLTNPIVIWALTGFFTYTIGQVLVATPLSSLLLGRAGIVEFLTETGICGDYSGHADWGIIACMLFLPPYIFLAYYFPLLIISITVWAVISIRARNLIWMLSRQQRWALILAMCGFTFFLFIHNISKFSEYALFTGPIHGFHPFLPLLVSFCNFIVPLIVWVVIDQATKTAFGGN